MVWLSRLGPVRPIARLSNPYSALWLYPRFASRPTPFWLIPYVPRSCQVDDVFESNKLPLETAQLEGTVVNTEVEQAYSDKGTSETGEAVETSTLTSCSDEPTRRSKVLHGPSFPSLHTGSEDRTLPAEETREGYKYSLAEITTAVVAASSDKHFAVRTANVHIIMGRRILNENMPTLGSHLLWEGDACSS